MATTATKARRMMAARALFDALRGSRPGAPGIGERFRAVPRLFAATMSGRYPGMTRGRLGMLLAGLVYLISPIDLVPELFLTVFGLGDDALVAAWLAGTVLAETEQFIGWERTGRRATGGGTSERRPRWGRAERAPQPIVVVGEVVDDGRRRRR